MLIDRTNKILKQKAKEIPPALIGSAGVKTLIAEMKKVLHQEDDGVAIAAPQVGAALRLFIVSGRVFELKERELKALHDELEAEKRLKGRKKKSHSKDMVFINPRIMKSSKDSEWMLEGCLSLRWLYGNVERKKKVTIEAYDEKGKRYVRGASGLLAQIFQHETDHLDGVLFTDKAKDVENIPPELQKEYEKRHAQ